MKNISEKKVSAIKSPTVNNPARRGLFSRFGQLAAGSALAGILLPNAARAHYDEAREQAKESRFPGDPPLHKIVYQFNQSDAEYHSHVIGSVGAMLTKYQDNIDIVVACFSRGIHILAKNPERPVDSLITEKVLSLSEQGVKFHACARTMESMNWTAEDMLPFVEIVSVGVADIMELQEQNYSYMAW